MPEARTWAGPAHDAAAAMFTRATDKASNIAHYADAVAKAFDTGSRTIGSARLALLNKAAEIEDGQLYVTDEWIVMIEPATMSAEAAAALIQRAESEQAEINTLLLDVGDADDKTAAALAAAGANYGLKVPSDQPSLSGLLLPGSSRPADEVPNPSDPFGLMQQAAIRGKDMATIVRDTEEWSEDGQRGKTLYMLDGSRHEIFEWGRSVREGRPTAPSHPGDVPGDTIADDYYSKDGKLISSTHFQTQFDHETLFETKYGDGTTVSIRQLADGTLSGTVTTADGRVGKLPDTFFDDPVETAIGGAITGVEKTAERGIPKVNPDILERVEKGARYGGPALGVGQTIFKALTAANFHDACVETWKGTAGLAGGQVGSKLLLAIGPETGPLVFLLAMGGDMLGTWTFGYMGGLIGEAVCPA